MTIDMSEATMNTPASWNTFMRTRKRNSSMPLPRYSTWCVGHWCERMVSVARRHVPCGG